MVFFRKQFSKFWASDNSDLQIKWSLQNKTIDYNNYIYIKTILSTQIYLFVTQSKKYVRLMNNCAAGDRPIGIYVNSKHGRVLTSDVGPETGLGLNTAFF